MKNKNTRRIMLTIAITLITITCMFFLNRYFNGFYSAEFIGGRFAFQDNIYVQGHFLFKKGDLIGKASRIWDVYSISGDEEHNFIFVSSWSERYYFIKEDYEIPTEGDITSVYIDNKIITDEDFCDIIANIIVTEEDICKIDNSIYDNRHSIFVAYNDCPVGAINMGVIACVNDVWILLESDEYFKLDKGAEFISCQIINDEYIPILEKFINDD